MLRTGKWGIRLIMVLTVLGIQAKSLDAAELLVPGGYATIQEAITAATGGDTVTVADGVYYGDGNRDLTFGGKAITLQSENGPYTCTIDCGGSAGNEHRGITINNANENVTIDGFTIMNGYTSTGGGISCRYASPTITNCVLRNNTAEDHGGGIYTNQSNLTITNCLIYGNTVTNIAGTNAQGGGVYLDQDSDATITDCVIRDNYALNYGGGIRTGNASPTITNCLIQGNTADIYDGGGLYCRGRDDASVTRLINCVISGNQAQSDYSFGGGLFTNWPTKIELTNCTVIGNFANRGGGISTYYNSQMWLTNTIVRDNRATDDGSQLCLYGSNDSPSWVSVEYCNIPGGASDIYLRNASNTLAWGAGNFETNPNFVTPGSWDDNSTPADLTDDIWVEGDYHLNSTSPCIDAADGNEASNTDLEGSTRFDVTTVANTGTGSPAYTDMGAYEVHVPPVATTGTLSIDSLPVKGTVYVDGTSWGTAPKSQTISTGIHTVSFGDVNGYYKPDDQYAVVYNGQTTLFNGDYVSTSATGTLTVDTSPFAAEVFVESTSWGTAPQSRDLAAGEYTVSFADVTDYVTPANQTITVYLNQTSQANGVYTLATGTLYVNTSPVKGAIYINGSNYGSAPLTEVLDIGEYTVSFGSVIGYDTPAPMQVSVLRDQTTSANVTYTVGSPPSTEPNELYVPSVYATIQDAIDVADTGDIVIVADGTYSGTGNRDLVFRNKPITVRSENGASACTIDCGGSVGDLHRGFIFDDYNENCTIDGFTVMNGYEDVGGAVSCRYASPTFAYCIFKNNTAADYGGAIYTYKSNVNISNSLIYDNIVTNLAETNAQGGGIYLGENSDATITECVIRDNTALNYGGGIQTFFASPTLINCSIQDNNAINYDGGGIYCRGRNDESFTELINCKITGNWTDYANGLGGGFCTYWATKVEFTNCTITGNSAKEGGGIYGSYDTELWLKNSIVWGNRAAVWGEQIRMRGSNDMPTWISVEYSDVQGGQSDVSLTSYDTLVWGTGNINIDPNFVAPGTWDDNTTPADKSDDTWIEGNYHLSALSPCLDAGDPTFTAPDSPTDLAGNDRIINNIVDMGIYEEAIIIVSKLTVKSGKIPAAGLDSFALTAFLDAPASAYTGIGTVDVQVGPYTESINCSSIPAGKNSKYTYRGASGAIQSLVMDLGKSKLTIAGKNVSLTGLSDPVQIALSFGTYSGVGLAWDSGSNDVVNTSKAIPLQFMVGYQNTLEITRLKFSGGNDIGTLAVQGSIALADNNVLLNNEIVSISVGSILPFDIAGISAKPNKKYSYKGAKTNDGSAYVSSAQFDLNKCTFKVTINNLDISSQPDSVNFGIAFTGFNQTDNINLR
ncbi:MAG: right-handed parallel beta-helix repeat-containing protein [Sedimentisphaerales bacterium]|nr:right-handed parallel beta-helix repeat-containing protein [Sedimentisphaerales bacterium]